MDSTLSSYQVGDLLLYARYGIVRFAALCHCNPSVYVSGAPYFNKEHQTHTQTDCNDIPEDGLKNGTETCKGKFLIVFNVNFSDF